MLRNPRPKNVDLKHLWTGAETALATWKQSRSEEVLCRSPLAKNKVKQRCPSGEATVQTF